MKRISKYAVRFSFALILTMLFFANSVSAEEVTTYDEYKKCMSTANATCDLTADIEDAAYFWYAKGTTLNLNNHSISGPSFLVLASSGTVTVNGPGVLETTDDENGGVIYVYGGDKDNANIVTVNINNVTVKNDKGWSAYIQNRPKNADGIYPAYGATINFNDSKLVGDAGVTILGNFQDIEAKNPPVINITDSTVDVGESAVYAAGYGLYNITNSILKANSALSVKSGTINVKNSKIYGIGEFNADVQSYNNGMRSAGGGIQIELNDGYSDHIKMYLKDTEVSSENGHAFHQFSAKGSVKSAIMDLVLDNCTFTSPKQNNFYTNDLFELTKFIKGGKYSNLPEKSYIADGYKAYYAASEEMFYIVKGAESLKVSDTIVLTVGETIKLTDNTPAFIGHALTNIAELNDEEIEELSKIVTFNDKEGTITGAVPGTVKYHVYLDDAFAVEGPAKDVTIVVIPSVEVVSNDEAVNTDEVVTDATAEKLNAELADEIKTLLETDPEDLTEENLEIRNAVLNGSVLALQLATDTVKEDDLKNSVVKKVNGALEKEETLVGYFDITIDVLVDGDKVSEIAELKNTLDVTVPLPTDLPKVAEGKTRVFYVVRVHGDNQEVTKLNAVDNGDGTLTFKSNKFSTFALAYQDVDAAQNDDTPNTGSIATIGIALMVASAGAFIVIKSKKFLD